MITRKEKLRKSLKAAWHHVAFRTQESIPVFIFGEMRSGTNMLTDCLDRSPRTAIYNESDDEAFEGYALRDNKTVATLVEKAMCDHVVFKSLADLARARELMQLFPSAKVIWIFRNYQDVVNSAMRKWTEHNKYLSYILNEPEAAGWRARNLPSSLVEVVRFHFERGISDQSARALIWFVRNTMLFEQRLETEPNVCLVRYEDLVRAPGTEFKRIFRFLGLPLRQSYYGKVSTGSIRRDEAPDIDDAIAAICEELFEKLVNQLEMRRNS